MKKFDNKFDRYPFSQLPKRPTYSWPNGAKLAVYFALNVEAFEFGRNPGPDFTSLPAAPFHRGFAYRDYGNRVGIWRILELFNRYQIPLAILTNTSVYDICPEVLVPFRERGDEFNVIVKLPEEATEGIESLLDLPIVIGDVGSTVVLEGAEGRHAVSVRRIAVGETVLLGDGAGRVVEAQGAYDQGRTAMLTLPSHVRQRPANRDLLQRLERKVGKD